MLFFYLCTDCFTGQFPSPPKGTSVKVTMNETSTAKANPYKWFVQLFSIKDKNLRLASVLKGVDGFGFGEFEDNQIDLFDLSFRCC
jgi:PII-like signaling protein